MNNRYHKQVALLIRAMPSIYKIKDFAIHGGTAINLFHQNMPRYSVDIDLTYIPIQDRATSLRNIDNLLLELKKELEKSIHGIIVQTRPDLHKLLCKLGEATVKVEVNSIKRGLIGDTVELGLCKKAQVEFDMCCKARTVSFSQLYGGKIAAALSRQHPRDLFDCKYMSLRSFDEVKDGFMVCLLGSDKPIIECLAPNPLNQRHALENQFEGMSDIPFKFEDYLEARSNLLELVNCNLTEGDKQFLVSFEEGIPEWDKCCAGDLSNFPSIQWKLLNIRKLEKDNPQKFKDGIVKLKTHLSL